MLKFTIIILKVIQQRQQSRVLKTKLQAYQKQERFTYNFLINGKI